MLYLCLARPDIADIWEQSPVIRFRDANGQQKNHVPDFLLTFIDGRRLAVAIKAVARVENTGFRDTLRYIRAAMPPEYADDLTLVTERSYTQSAARNAQKLHEFRRTPDPEADAAVADAIGAAPVVTTIAQLVERTGLGGRAFRATFKSTFSGMLRVLDAGDILPSTRVQWEGAK
ncbi:Tn7 transposase TnsA N-terminal domain-containing protein [Ruegeria sp. 2012CJ41-6]|uniref:Tn7 transposase TnsA N-terminal domain-containing protein n=1 Tax=Ruegeria spongiae TaxID=2942209 RepID=A0ABT0Q7B4_9RHOB|nr:Tn7 transposase TnsA N-terminal domain-containing protein [Ruegeria spongiae]MCL6285740.1 Tn7 transposase TnsA N-terminal domain-containing protein [Ruegeria spongiae]